MPIVSSQTIPSSFRGIGYTRDRRGFPLEAFDVPMPRPGPGQVLVRVLASSLNPLEHKLADLNFFGRKPPVVLGFDFAGEVVDAGNDVSGFVPGDAVAGIADCDGDGGWAEHGPGYLVARDALTVRKPDSITFEAAAALPICFVSAFMALHGRLQAGQSVYIPGGGGGTGHLAVQMAAHVLKAGLVVSSAGTPESIALARRSGADHVFDYRNEDVAAALARLTDGAGVDLVYDATYSEQSFVDTSRMVRGGGTWTVLGVGPGRTTRRATTISPVDGILAARGARRIDVNLLGYFSDPHRLDAAGRQAFSLALDRAMAWAAEGKVRPHVAKTIDSTLAQINDELGAMRAGRSTPGKIAVRVG